MESPLIVLESGLDLSKVVTSGSILYINQEYDDDIDTNQEQTETDLISVDFIGAPVSSFNALEKEMVAVDQNGFVKKKIMVEGGGLPLHEGCTVFIAFSGYWENEAEAFDVKTISHPMEIDLKDHGLLPGLEVAVRSMLVGETSVFLFSYKVMYGEMGIPPRIKPKADCVFFIKLIKSVLTPKEGKIQYSEPNMFQRVLYETKKLYSSGTTLYQANNYLGAIQLFNKAVNMLHKCRLADEKEETVQEKLLIKLYINLAICYNKVNKPLKTCTACNELNRLNSLWNNGKVLFQNAKALRKIGQYTEAKHRLQRAMKLCPNRKEMEDELELLTKTQEHSNATKNVAEKVLGPATQSMNDFKKEIDSVIRNFKTNSTETQLVFPAGLNVDQMEYLREVCIRENLFFNKLDKDKEQAKIDQTVRVVDMGKTELKVDDYVVLKPKFCQQDVLDLANEIDNNL